MKTVRTRFAPSPTGYMHIGNLRTALYEYLIARKNNGKFILRIEDTDQERLVEGAVDVIYNTLKLVGLQHDEGPDIGGDYGPYVQSERKHLYKPFAEKLVEAGHAYYCFCTKERLAEIRHTEESGVVVAKYDRHCLNLSKEEIQKNLDAGIPYVIRQKVPDGGTTSFDDAVYGTITVDNSTLEDQVLLKSDGMPTYNFANVVDDHLMEITHVVRGSEYLSSTPKYNLLYQAFGWDIPTYIHLPVVQKAPGVKISKRSGDASFEDLVEMGYLVEAVVNYIVLLGWSPGTTNQEIFSLKELEGIFDIHHINKAPAIFDMDKLNWMNGEYIRALSSEKFYEIAKPFIEKGIKNTDLDTFRISKILQQRTEVLGNIPENIDFFDALCDYDLDIYIHKKMKTTYENSLMSLKEAYEALKQVCDWNEENIHTALFGLVEKLQIKNGQMLWPVRTAISGKQVTPGGAVEIADILGKDETLYRIEIGIERLSAKLAE